MLMSVIANLSYSFSISHTHSVTVRLTFPVCSVSKIKLGSLWLFLVVAFSVKYPSFRIFSRDRNFLETRLVENLNTFVKANRMEGRKPAVNAKLRLRYKARLPLVVSVKEDNKHS